MNRPVGKKAAKPRKLGQSNGALPRPRGRRSPDAELFILLQKTADRSMQGLEQALRNTGFTAVQYLVMRSLRQAGATGMPSNQIVRNMTTHDPDLTRLLDKLEARGVILRRRDKVDRRVYRVKLTRAGIGLLRALTRLTAELHAAQFASLGRENVAGLSRLLATVHQTPLPDYSRE